jgi:lauroyl/myristoyl acyltransferase
VAVDFMGGPYYLPKTVPLLAKRARVSILPYIGYYDLQQGKHRVSWFPPIPPRQRDSDTLQAIMACFQPTFERHPEFYFNVLEHHRTPWG